MGIFTQTYEKNVTMVKGRNRNCKLILIVDSVFAEKKTLPLIPIYRMEPE